MLIERNEPLLDDRVNRALGILKSARLLGIDEAMKLLSRVRLGIALGRLKDVEMSTIQRLFLELQPAHLMHRNLDQVEYADANVEGNSIEDTANLRFIRAEVTRHALN